MIEDDHGRQEPPKASRFSDIVVVATLLWVLPGLIEPDAGTITPGDRFDRAAIVVQTYGMLPVPTAKENVELPLLMRGATGDEARRRTEDALAQAGLPDLHDRLAEELSGGQRQRVAVARALAMQARLLVADEPTAELDRDTAALVVTALRAEAAAGATVVLSTNDPTLASTCDRVYHLHDGAITRDQVSRLNRSRACAIGSTSSQQRAAVFRDQERLAVGRRLTSESGRLVELDGPDSLKSGCSRFRVSVGEGGRSRVLIRMLPLGQHGELSHAD